MRDDIFETSYALTERVCERVEVTTEDMLPLVQLILGKCAELALAKGEKTCEFISHVADVSNGDYDVSDITETMSGEYTVRMVDAYRPQLAALYSISSEKLEQWAAYDASDPLCVQQRNSCVLLHLCLYVLFELFDDILRSDSNLAYRLDMAYNLEKDYTIILFP